MSKFPTPSAPHPCHRHAYSQDAPSARARARDSTLQSCIFIRSWGGYVASHERCSLLVRAITASHTRRPPASPSPSLPAYAPQILIGQIVRSTNRDENHAPLTRRLGRRGISCWPVRPHRLVSALARRRGECDCYVGHQYTRCFGALPRTKAASGEKSAICGVQGWYRGWAWTENWRSCSRHRSQGEWTSSQACLL